MGCCGGPLSKASAIRIAPKSLIQPIRPASQLRPRSTRTIVLQASNGLRVCPNCGTILSIEYSNGAAAIRGRCSKCQKVYSLQ